EGVHGRLRDYVAAIPPPDQDEIRSVEDLAPVIELYHHTVGAGQYDEAVELYRDRLAFLLYFRLGAYYTTIELLRSLFPEGEDHPPKLEAQAAQPWTLHELANSYARSGQPGRAVPLKGRANHIWEMTSASKENIAIGLRSLADDQIELGELVAVERNLRRSIQVSREIEGPQQAEMREAIGRQELGRLLSYRGAFGEAAQELEAALDSFSKLAQRQAEGVVWVFRAERALHMGQAYAALEAAREARQLADVRGFERDIVRAEGLLGAVLIALAPEAGDEQNNALVEAESHLAQALAGARRINLVEHEPDILLAWARWHRAKGDYQRAREHAEEALAIADRSEYRLKQADIHNFLARLSLDERDLQAARTHAEAARERARCDGPPHAYQPALDEAEQLLNELGQNLA
ncbi:MAG: tetratricopeptide repeat protein, partial [Chloroflexi bacterium]|nr:tetratricopeptide repeat protein [Chloroflexota bacterium]